MLTATIVTTATHADVVSFWAKKITNGIFEIGRERLETIQAQGSVKNVDDVLHFFRFIYPDPDFPDQSQDLAPFPPGGGGLLALLRACLSALLYKSVKRLLIRLRNTNVERDNLVSKFANKLFFRQILTTVRFLR